ncbi:hypothetical protein QEJ31_07750 [Pigmentibacter sp. JX0631]|uniref:ABC-three component system protein n=1 Tax=Pigmentibacter sp. JX0631 TaxID=2976982 RepID=UPI00246956AC|nr:ABC-three component system protein [Pigmentibacter sp. JX0631]WGL61482.1 hypothetical protein QEJ31_07750 [Pigmentibacter sp. JX0631]
MLESIKQKNNTAGRNIVAGNMVENNFLINLNIPKEIEETSDVEIKKSIYKFMKFLKKNEEENELIGLEKKLIDAHMNSSVKRALKKKEEAFTMCLMNSLHPEFIIKTAHCLSFIEYEFSNKIESFFDENENITRNEEKRKGIKKIQDEVITDCNKIYNFFDFGDIEGLLFMLAGHCHIKWVP